MGARSEVVLPFQVFVALFSVALMAGSLIVLTPPGQTLLLRASRWIGTHSSIGPWAFRADYAPDPSIAGLSLPQRLHLAESYVSSARERTVRDARIVLWVLIGGCVTAAVTGLLITAVLPPLVVSGAWSYETYRRAALAAIYIGVAGGIAAAVGLVMWLIRDTVLLTSTYESHAARSVIAQVMGHGVDAELAHELSSGPFPGLRDLLHGRG